jgi:VCBS repeat-containing protein
MAGIVKKPIQISFRDLCGIINVAPIVNSGVAPVRVKETADNAAGENQVIHTGSSILKFTDNNASDIHKASVVPLSGGYLGSFYLSPVNQTANTVNWTFKVSDAKIDHLQAGETLTQKYRVTINDGHGGKATKDVTVVIVGTNDVPVLKCPDDNHDDDNDDNGDARLALTNESDPVCDVSGSVTEDNVLPPSTTLSDTGSFKFDDVDLKDTHTITVFSSGNLGTLTATLTDTATGIGDGTITWTYKVNNNLVQGLDDGESKIETFNIKIDDGHGGVVFQPVIVTIHGVNDAPVANADTNWVKEDTEVSAAGNVLLTASHPAILPGQPTGPFGDQADTDVDGDSLSVTPGTFLGTYGKLVLNADGSYNYTLYTQAENAAADALVQSLRPGDAPLTDSFSYTVTDGDASDSSTLTISVFGTDDGVEITGIGLAGGDQTCLTARRPHPKTL